jgi:predicted PurR-regulated permease PerM
MILTSNSGLLTPAKDILSLITSTIFAAVLVIPLTAVYYFKEKRTLKQKIVSFAPDKYKEIFEKTIQDVVNDIKIYTIVKILEVFIISFLYCICFYVIGLPHCFIIGLLIGISNFVPYIGFIIPAVPAIVYAYSAGIDIMFAVVGAIIIIQLFNYFIILPNMVMKTIQISPLTAVLLTLVGLKLFGFFGLIFALPIYIFCKVVLIACYKLLVVMYPDSTNDLKEIAD